MPTSPFNCLGHVQMPLMFDENCGLIQNKYFLIPKG